MKKTTSKETSGKETAIVVGITASGRDRARSEEYLEELTLLADTAGAEVRHSFLQERSRMDPATFIGKGKAEEIGKIATEEKIDIAIFDDDLSPVQVRNLEKIIPAKIVDRSGLILDIFASRAKSKESMTQVELAQLQYMLPRLTRQWTHLSKQFGGIGTKGPGETQIETDRRAIRKKITHLKEKLLDIDNERTVQRKGREEHTRVALVGYTNAGKSTLLKLFSDADVLIEDRLFATLDTTVRMVQLSPGRKILLSDTVGFIRKLPAQLVASFRSTLAEVTEADLLLHVIDVSHPQCADQIEVVEKTLEELGVAEKPTIYVFNKIDKVKNRAAVRELTERYVNSVIISASRNINVPRLRDALLEKLDEDTIVETVVVNQSESRTIALIHQVAEVLKKEYEEHTVEIRFRVSKKNYERLRRALSKSAR